ncbi:MAG: sugar ABC transporter ATP-binding protein [Candidatus Limiplasma sp.]|nr:sugar ABC transporter ATP-binding protein [Candidatus Limiplasma sp.]
MIISVENIVKEFSGVRVLDHVNFSLEKGEVHALLGENGAGKSTLMKILAGVYQQTSGTITVEGKCVDFKSRSDADAHGIGIIFQEFSQVPQLSVVDNLFLGKELHKKYAGGIVKPLDRKEMGVQALEIMKKFNMEIPLDVPVKKLGVATQQLIEICKALFNNAKILIMDEPTSALSEGEIEQFFTIIKELKNQGVSIIYISHRLQEIKKICDRATILRDGKNVATIDVKQHSIEAIISMMIGRDIKDIYPEKSKAQGDLLLRLDRLSSPGKFKNVSFGVRTGEIVGITGLVGAGKTELLNAIFGLDSMCKGSIYVHEKLTQIKTPAAARAAGIAHIPEDRKRHGVIIRHSAYANIMLPNLREYRNKYRLLDLKRSRKSVLECMKQVDIRPLEPQKRAGLFSGGNQQKVVIAKWLKTGARVYLFDEPTRGVDVGAKAAIYQLISQLASSGCGVILCSSEIHEVMGLSNKIVVMNKGSVAAITDDTAKESEILLKAQLGEENSGKE